MADTLMGLHKDVTCRECGHPYRVGISTGMSDQTSGVPEGLDIVRSVCPLCRYEMDVRRDRAFSGDRVLVNKFVYHFKEPRRWDVAVFKYPQGAKTNFIKRLVGLPNETIRIHRGDLFVQGPDEDDFTIARRPPEKIRVMLHPIHDTEHLPAALLERGWPSRWQPETNSPGWQVDDDLRAFSNDGSSDQESWLRYHHLPPSQRTWNAADRGMPLDQYQKPELISDYCAYNSGTSDDHYRQRQEEIAERRRNGLPTPIDLEETKGPGLHWVGDLAVSCVLDARGGQGDVILELVEGGRRMRCRIDVATGRAELSIVGDEFRREAATAVSGPGTYELMFANIDDQLLLWVNGKVVAFDEPTTYAPLGNTTPELADLAPVGIASRGADIHVSQLKVLRDIYYIAVGPSQNVPMPPCDYRYPSALFEGSYSASNVRSFLSTPAIWPEAFSDRNMREAVFPLREDQFLMLGDNSPQSKDSRMWTEEEYFVDRELLIGKALFVYWPHSWDKIWIGEEESIPFPFFPNFKQMRFVR
ncbi:MAG: signal peptidase I [Pirellulaceae bacterium]|nr:signal peptidase I [Pirellulaceae bacterium]